MLTNYCNKLFSIGWFEHQRVKTSSCACRELYQTISWGGAVPSIVLIVRLPSNKQRLNKESKYAYCPQMLHYSFNQSQQCLAYCVPKPLNLIYIFYPETKS